MKIALSILAGLVGAYVLLSLVGAVFIGALKDRARRNHERRHEADRTPPRLGM